MGVTETKVKYQAGDGREFTSRVEAERYDALREARDEYDRARARFGKALAKTHRTADGELFDFGVWYDYWLLVEPIFGVPHVDRVTVWGGYGFDFDHRAELEIKAKIGDRDVRVKISDLYVHERNAREACVDATERWLTEQRAQLDESREKLGLRAPEPSGGQ